MFFSFLDSESSVGMVGKSVGNSRDRNLERKIAQKRVSDWYKRYGKMLEALVMLQSQVIFVTPVTAGGSVKNLPMV